MTTTQYPVWVAHYEIPDGHYYADIQELDGIVRLGPGDVDKSGRCMHGIQGCQECGK
jgi:hypothetical protein